MNAREIRRLRNNFIRVAMLSIFLVIAFIGGMINLVNYQTMRREIKWTLNYLIENRGEIEEDEDAIGENFRNPSLPDILALTYHRNSYYVFVYDEEGNPITFRSDRDDSRSMETIENYADTVLSRRRDFGRYGVYYYKRSIEDGQMILALMDCRETIFSRSRLIFLSLVIAVVGMLVTFFLVRAFSERVIQPEIENSRRQEQFITNASHELKTPLAVIRANTEMQELLAGENEWTKSTLRQVDSLSGLIQNLVMISKSREQEDSGELAQTDVSRAVSESAAPFEVMVKQQAKEMLLEIPQNVTLRTDGSKIRQLTTVLVDNAIKYCDEGGRVRVELEQIRRGKGIMLTVSNSYKDGEKVDYNRFFDRFYREDSSHNKDRGGYGIGLSIAESICEQHRGNIRVKWKNGDISFVCQLMEQK